jgi:hypothetical protein
MNIATRKPLEQLIMHVLLAGCFLKCVIMVVDYCFGCTTQCHAPQVVLEHGRVLSEETKGILMEC